MPVVLWGRADAQFEGLIVLTASAVPGSERLESALAMIDERVNFNQNGACGVFRGGKQINQSTRPSILLSRLLPPIPHHHHHPLPPSHDQYFTGRGRFIRLLPISTSSSPPPAIRSSISIPCLLRELRPPPGNTTELNTISAAS